MASNIVKKLLLAVCLTTVTGSALHAGFGDTIAEFSYNHPFITSLIPSTAWLTRCGKSLRGRGITFTFDLAKILCVSIPGSFATKWFAHRSLYHSGIQHKPWVWDIGFNIPGAKKAKKEYRNGRLYIGNKPACKLDDLEEKQTPDKDSEAQALYLAETGWVTHCNAGCNNEVGELYNQVTSNSK